MDSVNHGTSQSKLNILDLRLDWVCVEVKMKVIRFGGFVSFNRISF